MKIKVLTLTLALMSAPAFADQAVEITCQPKSKPRHELPAEGAILKANVVLLGGSLAQGAIVNLSFADNDGKLYDFTVKNARPEVTNEFGEGATALVFDYAGESTALRSVQLLLRGELKRGHTDGEITIRAKDAVKLTSDVYCEID